MSVPKCTVSNTYNSNRLQEIQDKADRCQHKMNQATALISGLAGEQKRWTAQLAQFKAETDRLVGDVILLTGFLSYCGPFNHEFRVMLQKGWIEQLEKLDIPYTQNLKIVDLLVDAATVNILYLRTVTFLNAVHCR